ncbi:mitochondrial chaperone BCS1 [Plectosphaerella plurivora]|uniref:Mitochondrial chaperone BCS1 n=1 Tax=Plectosphaerella plurivora TaxID=936078 RepID=A0A9P9A7H1_9PEZI|nr:mitochondrial chaperone BCS1 [Plectosphaerella plurivora]
MDVRTLLDGLFGIPNTTMADSPPSVGPESCTPSPDSHRMPRNPVLDALGPLLGGQFSPILRTLTLVNQVFGARLGIDPTLLLTLVGAAWALSRMWRQLSAAVTAFVIAHFMSSIHVASSDEIYTHMMKWLAVQPLVTSSRSLTAETVAQTAWEEEEELEALQLRSIAGGGDAKYFNFSNQRAKAPPRFVPAVGIHGFWSGGRYFRLHRRQQTVVDDQGGNGRVEKEEMLVISCFGRSTDPIKALLRTVKDYHYSDHIARTTIKRPLPSNSLRRFNARNWYTIAIRPVRSLSTVVLDASQKGAVLADMNEYLHPATPRWYANRGIPLRRGYLFHGPPGTGKTSLSFALAGVFGLDIYVISLLDPNLTEEDLSTLFSSLPRRCVVLLEDIDAAGLKRPAEEVEVEEVEVEADGKAEEAKQNGEQPVNGHTSPTTNGEKAGAERKGGRRGPRGGASSNKDDWKVADLARALKGSGPGGADEKKGISLSGLLNAIDGVASQEGRVLVMTTNRPESLDEALIRPGRVDLQVAFANATGHQARELFERMYEADTPPRAARQAKAEREAASTMDGAGDDADRANRDIIDGVAGEGALAQSGSEELRRVADEFGRKIPDGVLSPAEIQGFLLKRKKDPERALAETGRWVTAMQAQKESRTKVLSVQ